MSNNLSIAINIFVLIFASIGFLTSIGILFLIFYCRQQSPINTPILLICNTYISIMFISIILLDMHAHYLFGDLYSNVSFDNLWCYLRAYFLHVGICLLYHSYLLQAVFRFFRIVFYKNKQLQTLRFMFQLVLIQWVIDFLCMLPFLLLHYFHYIPPYYYCEILLTSNQGMLLMGTITYTFPMTAIELIYYYILYYIKKTKSQVILQNRHRANQRDVVVLRRIIILIGLLVMLGLPIFIIWLWYIFTNHLNLIGYRLGWSLFTFSLSILPITTAIITPQLRELLTVLYRRNRRIHPVIRMRPDENNQTAARH